MSRKIAITKRSLLATSVLTTVLFPILCESIISTAFGDEASRICSILACLALLLLTIKNKTLHLSKFIVLSCILILFHIFITLLSPASKITNANNLITPYGMIAYTMLFIYISTCLAKRSNLHQVLLAATTATTIGVIVNIFLTGDLSIADNIATLQQAISTNYTRRTWLFGHRNKIFIHHLLWILFTYLYYYINHKNYRPIFIAQIICTLFVSILSWNSTMIITTIIIAILAILNNSMLKKINIIHYIVVFLILEINIVFLRTQELFATIIVQYLHRNLTFTGRTAIWNYYIKQFLEEPQFNKLVGNLGQTQLGVNSHNMALGLLSFTGILGTLIYALLCLFSIIELYKNRSSSFARFISIIIFGFLVNALTMEFYLQPLLAFFIGFSSSDFIKIAKETTRKEAK